MAVQVTAELIEAGKSDAGGWTKEQLEILGVSWPPVKGWKNRVKTWISEEESFRFRQLSGKPIPEAKKPLTKAERDEEAMRLMVVNLPAGWIEIPDRADPGNNKLSPKAVQLRDAISAALERAYLRGRELTVEEYRAGKR